VGAGVGQGPGHERSADQGAEGNVGDRLDGQGRPSGSALVPLVAAWFARGLAVGGVPGIGW
jgi:hypothetical protein